MSTSKVKIFERNIKITSDVVTGTGPYIHTITVPTHHLTTGDVVVFASAGMNEFRNTSAAVTVTNATVFTVSLSFSVNLTDTVLLIPFYSGGMTGGQASVSWPQGSVPGVIQAVSTGAATFAIEASLDNVNFVNLASITLVSAGSDFFVLDANWAYIRVNITSIAATKLIRVYRSV